MKKMLFALVFLLLISSSKVTVTPAWAQTATDSADATDSATYDDELDYPEELPETGSTDIVFSLGMGGFLVLTAIITRVTLAKLS